MMGTIIGLSSMNSDTKPPIFVLGCQRSGTSLLRRLLDSHSNITCPPESAFIVQLSRIYEIKRALQGLRDMGFSKAEVLEQMRVFAVHFFEKYGRARGKKRWADKTCHYVNHMDTIDLMFGGEVVYIGMVRNGLDVAYSLCDFDWGVLKPYLANGTEKPIAAVRFWKDQNTKLLDFRDKVKDRFYLIKYEDLTTSPESVLPPLFEFLGEPWEKHIINYNEFEHNSGFEDPKVSRYKAIETNTGNYKKWPMDIQQRVCGEAHGLLKRFDYVR